MNDKFILGLQEYEVVSQKETLLVDERLFNNVDKLDSLRRFFNNASQVLSVPILSSKRNEELFCVLQVAEPIVSGGAGQNPNPTKNKRKRLFTIKEELMAQLIGKVLGLCIDMEVHQSKIKLLKQHHREFAKAGGSFSVH